MTKVMTAKNGENIVVWGDGTEERDLLYVWDLVEFLKLVIDKQVLQFDLYNVGYGNSISIGDLVEKIKKCSGKNIMIKYDQSKPSIKTKLCLNIEKAKKIIGWTPKVSLDDGIQKMMEWYRENFN